MPDETNSSEHHIMIGAIEKNARDTIVVQVRSYKGKDYVDVRNHYHDTEGELKPTQKGISLETSRFIELKELIDKIPAALESLAKEGK